jgi:GTP-binding protein
VVGYGPFRGAFESRSSGSLVSDRAGKAVAYGLFHLQPRGRLFVRPNDVVYEGMIVGEHNRSNDLNINPCREKKLTNLRAAGKDENVILTPVQPPTLEQALQFIRDDERVEVTPKSIRMHKVELQANKRKGPGSRM